MDSAGDEKVLYDHQLEAIDKLRSGSILCGGVGSGKSRTSLAYFFTKECKGHYGRGCYMDAPKDLYIITTARKRDTHEWEDELLYFGLTCDREKNYFGVSVMIDSWNNIAKYVGVKGAFFIFDEQRVVGSGKWAKSFIFIAKQNHWLLLSATPGDTWMDYISVFVANGYYRNRSAFIREHVIYSRYAHFPKVERYLDEEKLRELRDRTVVQMMFDRATRSHHIYTYIAYDKALYNKAMKTRMNPFTNEPINDAGGLCYVLRRICNDSAERASKCVELCKERKKAIIFYNFDYELDRLRESLADAGVAFAEWNGHKHGAIPSGDEWAYLVQYTAGAEGWNCVETDTIIFYSQNYSYKTMVQAAGRIDRLNTPYVDLYYYHLSSLSTIDFSIKAAVDKKENFNERLFAPDLKS